MKKYLILTLTLFLFNGCGESKKDERKECEISQVGEVYFENSSKSNSTYDIIWDGIKIVTVEPNQKSENFTYAANVPHTLVFRLTNSTDDACTPSTPILTQCQVSSFSCSQ